MYSIKIVTTDKEINLDNLSEQDTEMILKNVYDSIKNIQEYIKFTDSIKISAFELEYFVVQ